MQKFTDYIIESIDVDKIESLYKEFERKSVIEYGFIYPASPFEEFKSSVLSKSVKGLVLTENKEPKAFLLYVEETHRTIEINVIYVNKQEDFNPKVLALLEALIEKFRASDGLDVISYPMTGIQQSFVRDISLLGFNFVGQAVVKFDYCNPISNEIFNKVKLPDLDNGYFIDSWDDKYYEQASEVIHEAFKEAKDVYFDPRFLSLDGSKSLVKNIISGYFGPFISNATSVLVHNENVAGVCFVNASTVSLLNIPLIGMKRGHNNKGLGKYLLKSSLDKVRKNILSGVLSQNMINAGVETDNFPAIKMYRRLGFIEDYTYPQAYVDKRRLELIDKIHKKVSN